MNVLDLFSGIGGFSLGLERAGMRTVAFCEIEPFCRAVLRKHWPGVKQYDDVRTLSASQLAADGIAVDVICGGFPCQDISTAGKGAGIEGERSGLWREYARLVGELRPRYIIVENVAALLGRGLSRVLGDLAALGYDAEWHCIPASYVGAPHRRDRIWIIAYPNLQHGERGSKSQFAQRLSGETWAEFVGGGSDVAYPSELHGDGGNHFTGISLGQKSVSESGNDGRAQFMADSDSPQRKRNKLPVRAPQKHTNFSGASWWAIEPDVGRVANGVPARVDRLKGLGNAVVPQIPEIIARAILKAEAA